MRVARDDQLDAALAREPGVDVREVEPIELTVDLERDAVRGRGVAISCSMLSCDGFAPQQHAAGRVRDDVDPGMLDRAQHASGDLRSRPAGCAECTDAMTMSSWARQSAARSMRTVGEDVALDAGEDAGCRRCGAFERANARRVRERAVFRRARWPSPAPCCDR